MNALISGASSGIGNAIAQRLNQLGYRIAAISHSAENLEKLGDDLHNPLLLQADLRQQQDCDAIFRQMIETGFSPDLIVNCAGVYAENLPSEMQEQGLQDLLALNFWAAFRITQPWLARFRSRGEGTIVTIGSVVNQSLRTHAAAYTLSKRLLDDYMKLLATELRTAGIRVCRIQPGSVFTPSWDADVPEAGAMVQPAEVADMVEAVLCLRPEAWVEELVIRPLNPAV